MIGSEARAARLSLGLSEEALAAETDVTPDAVAAWESGRIKVPRRIAVDLTWRVAQAERLAALAASGLPGCAWVAAFEAQPLPEALKARTARLERLLDHMKVCDVCKAREAFVAERFPPMPPAPRHGWLAIAIPVAERVERLPSWAQPAATGAILFIAYSLFKLVIMLPAILRSPGRGVPTAIEGIVLSGSIGAVLGLIYGQYRGLRQRWAARRTT